MFFDWSSQLLFFSRQPLESNFSTNSSGLKSPVETWAKATAGREVNREWFPYIPYAPCTAYLPTCAQHKSPSHVGKYTNGVYGFIWVWHVSSSLCKWSYSSRFATSTARTQRISQLGRPCPRVEPMWSSTWAEIAPKRLQLPSCAMIGPKLEPSGSKLGRSWACYWPKLTQVEPMLRPCRIETVHLDDVGPICKMCKLPVPCTFWRGGDPENGPPQLKLHQWTENCSNRSAPLLNYHASAPLGRADLYLLCNMHMDIYGVYYLQNTWYALYGSVLCILYIHIHIQMDSSHRSILDWCTIVDGYCLKLSIEAARTTTGKIPISHFQQKACWISCCCA